MPPPNRLAPDPYNSLYYSVPTPAALEPQYVPPMPLRQQLENVSAGLGRGVTSQLQDVQALLSDPRAYATNTLRGLRELVRNPALVGNVLRDTARRATSGPLGLGEVAGEMLPLGVRSRTPVRRDIDVYHGSPHKFERFDPSKIGTGEGAQAYGHGLYFAESPDVAKNYAHNLTARRADRVRIDGNPVSTDTMLGRAIEDVGLLGRDAALQKLDDNIRFNDKYAPDIASLYRSVRKEIEQIDPQSVTVNRGNLYTVDLPDDAVETMLDWDAPLADQPFMAQSAIYNGLTDAGYSKAFVNDLLNRKSGMELYRTLYKGLEQGDENALNLARQLVPEDKGLTMSAPALASEALRRMGIRGIKYLDAGSRDAKKGTRNFVVFPGEEQQLRILKRE